MIRPNSLYASDSLALLERIDDGVARLCYLDPPWFSQSRNVSDRHSGVPSLSDVRQFFEAFSRVLQQCHRVLAENGSVILHIEPALAQNFSLLLGQVFRNGFVGEYILPQFRMGRTSHLSLLHFSKGRNAILNEVFRPLSIEEGQAYSKSDTRGAYRVTDLTGRGNSPEFRFEWHGHSPPEGQSWRYDRSILDTMHQDNRIEFSQTGRPAGLKIYLGERKGVLVGSIWDDLQPLRRGVPEHLGFASQQPEGLLERVIDRATNPDDLVIDPYCGSGTSLVAAHRRNRRWIGGDLSPEAVQLCRNRINATGIQEGNDWQFYLNPDFSSISPKPCFFRRIVAVVDDLSAAEILIEEGENEMVEWKVSALWNAVTQQKDDNNKEKVIRSVSAFLNSRDGGSVLIGVADSGQVIGLEEDFRAANSQKQNQDAYELWLRSALLDRFGGEFAPFIRITFEEVSGKTVCLVRVAPAGEPAFTKQKLPVRRGNNTVDLSLQEAVEYARSRWPKS